VPARGAGTGRVTVEPVDRIAAEPAPLEVVPIRHRGRLLAAAACIAFVAWLVYKFASNPNLDWSAVADNLFAPSILSGLAVTVALTFLCMAIGIALGVLAAVMRMSANPVISVTAATYTWFFRGTPVLVQIIFWYNLALIFPTIGVGGISADTNVLMTSFVAATLGLSLNEGAYMAEIVRGGILAIDRGQTDAAQALGMNRSLTMRRIVLPQAMRVIIPPTGNEVINMLKMTSLVSVIAASDLLTAAQNIYAQSFQVIELLIVASIWYLVLTSILTYFQGKLERHYGRGY